MSDFTPHDVIYLQINDPDEPIGIDETTWCSDKINDDDIKYLLSTLEREAASELYQALNALWLKTEICDYNHAEYYEALRIIDLVEAPIERTVDDE